MADQAVGVLGARVVGLAWVDAVSVLAGPVERALGVGPAPDGDASSERIALVAVDAAAVGHVALRVALGVGAAGVVQEARVDALAVAARLAVLTLRVGLASDGLALDLWVADGPFRALTDRPVVGQEAVGALAAVARVHADPVDASVVLLALVVPDTAWLKKGI